MGGCRWGGSASIFYCVGRPLPMIFLSMHPAGAAEGQAKPLFRDPKHMPSIVVTA